MVGYNVPDAFIYTELVVVIDHYFQATLSNVLRVDLKGCSPKNFTDGLTWKKNSSSMTGDDVDFEILVC